MVGRLDVIADNLSHLGVDQQAFLSTGDERFQDGVIESIETLQLNIDVLNSLAAQSTSQGALLLELCRSIEEVIGNVGESDGIREVGSKAAAVAFFDSKEAEISQAISQTNQFRLKNMLSISDRVRSGRSGETLLAGFLADARRWQHAALSNSARQRERAGTAHHIRSHS